MDMKEYEEFALNVQSISNALNNAIQMAMENEGEEFVFSPLFPDFIHKKDECVENIDMIYASASTAPFSSFWKLINPEANVIGVSCKKEPWSNRKVYSVRFYKTNNFC